MRILRKLFDFYLDASLHVGFAVFCLVEVTLVKFEIQSNRYIAFALFFGTIMIYNFIKYGVEMKRYILVSNNYQRLIQIVSFACFFPGLYFLSKLTNQSYLYVLLALLLSAFYAIPILPQVKNFRKFGKWKIVLVAIVWSIVTVIIPLVNEGYPRNWDFFAEVIQRFLLVVALMIPFEIRDVHLDEQDLGTLPQRYGILQTKLFGIVVLVLTILTELLKDHTNSTNLLSITFIGIIISIFIWKSKEHQSSYYCSFWVEAIPIMWLIFFVLTT